MIKIFIGALLGIVACAGVAACSQFVEAERICEHNGGVWNQSIHKVECRNGSNYKWDTGFVPMWVLQ